MSTHRSPQQHSPQDTSTATDIQSILKQVPTGQFIGGCWQDGSTGRPIPVENPANGQVLANILAASEADARRALDAAVSAQAEWAATAPRQRSDILRRGFELVQERAETFATLMTLEMGKPLAEARGEVTYGAEFLRWFSEEAVRHYGQFYPQPEGNFQILTRRKPVGPCLLITPWNFPLAMATRKVAPALAAGCTMVLKPSELTPLSACYFVQTMADAGLPAGVLNLVVTDRPAEVSGPLLEDPRLRKLSFTGSTGVGKHLLTLAAENVLQTSLELGGNAPFIVFPDADLDAAVTGAVAAKMRNMGEACIAANRFLIHQDVAEEFTAKLAQKMGEFVVGDGLDPATTCGPLINAAAVSKLEDLVADAVAGGAQVVTGGARIAGPGNFFQPTVLAGVDPDMKLSCSEIFGPVAPVSTFRDEHEVIALANDTEYGLASYVFTSDNARILRMSEALEFGMMAANLGVMSNAAAPFGGIKHSGLGIEGGAQGIDEYSTIQYVSLG